MNVLIINGRHEFRHFLCFSPVLLFVHKFLMQKQLHIRYWSWNDRTDLYLEASCNTVC